MRIVRRYIPPRTFITLFTSIMLGVLSIVPQSASAVGFLVTNLVSDVEGQARFTDPTLINPWGLAIAPNGTLIVAVNGSNIASFFNPNGSKQARTINVPTAPTGVVLNNSPVDFQIRNGRTIRNTELIFVTESGTILAAPLQGQSNAVVVVDKSQSGAVFKGAALGTGVGGQTLFVADFHNGKVDMFNRNFQFVGSFTDPTVPRGFAPFNVRTFGNLVLVTFAKQKPPENEDDLAGPGNGFLDIFAFNGRAQMRLVSRGPLNSPWGMAVVVAPASFGRFANALLVGNFGDGHINAFSTTNGRFLGQLTDPNGAPIVIDGLWSLAFARNSSDLFFTAGPEEETHGLIGIIRPVRN
jgi:uncharacterized protein (TIGR03118 family)